PEPPRVLVAGRPRIQPARGVRHHRRLHVLPRPSHGPRDDACTGGHQGALGRGCGEPRREPCAVLEVGRRSGPAAELPRRHAARLLCVAVGVRDRVRDQLLLPSRDDRHRVADLRQRAGRTQPGCRSGRRHDPDRAAPHRGLPLAAAPHVEVAGMSMTRSTFSKPSGGTIGRWAVLLLAAIYFFGPLLAAISFTVKSATGGITFAAYA